MQKKELTISWHWIEFVQFWNDLTPQTRQELLKLDKQTFIEQARKNFYCSRCNGLLLECFTQIVMHGKSLQEAPDNDRLSATADSRIRRQEQDAVQDPSGYPWGGLSTTKDGTLTLLDCFVKAKSLQVLQNVFDNARAREREREMLYPDACGACGRGWISQGMASYSRGHGTREVCALHTARLSCDTLVDFWSALGEETRSSLLRMKEEDFIEKLMYRFDSKRFCRDCRRNVIREFKELKELKRMRWEPRCTSWFCVADTDFQCDVFEDAVIVDWSQYLSEEDVSYERFEWAVGTDEGESDVFGFENVGMNAQVHRDGINLDEFEDYFITLRAWRPDGDCDEFCVKAHALKGQSCVHHRLVVGDGFVTITKGESIRSFFEHAEEAEEEDEDDAMDRDGNDLDGGFHPQKHAKSPELAREFLLDAAAIIFKEQVEKAFREGTARQNAQSVFVSLALKLLEERVHVACKEIITLEKQNKLLEEEEKEKREEIERRMKRKTKERQKKLRRKERLKEKGNDKGKRLGELKLPDDISSSALSNLSGSTNDESTGTLDSRDSSSEEEDNVDICLDQSPCWELNGENNTDHCNAVTEYSPMDSSDSCTSEQSRSSKRSPSLKKDVPQVKSCCYGDSQNEPGRIGDLQWQSKERTRNYGGNCNLVSTTNNRTRDRHMYSPCSCGGREDYRDISSCLLSTDRSGREMKMARKAGVDKSGVQYRRHYPLNSYVVPKESHVCSNQKNAISKQVWEPSDVRKRTNLNDTDNASGTIDNVTPLKPMDCDAGGYQNTGVGCEPLSLTSESSSNLYKSETDQLLENGKRIEASCDGIPMTNEVSRRDEELMMNSTGSDSSSTCISEGDRESSSSSMTSSVTQNPETSSTDSEECSDRVNSTLSAPSLGTPSRSLLTCAGKGFREYQPKVTHPAHEGKFGVNTSPFQDLLLHHQSINATPLSPASIGIHNHSWLAPADGNFHYARPSHFPSSVMFGVPGNQFVDYPVQYSNINPYVTSGFRHMPPGLVSQTTASFRGMPPSPPPFHQNGGEQAACHPHRDMNLEGHRSKPKPLGLKDFPEDRKKSHDADASFSLFQFNLPIASPVAPSSKDDKSGEFAGKTSLAQAQAQLCSREQTDVKEYNLFSTKDSGIFSFMQIK
ncbi:hypothetical protein PR202_ga26483 [Eleusine coracana subsp. coracana]|uniref:Uncharacterized protein n=1 Tax=Eleusine coracana subsp. coracana TaxID=191504 RepID=A0AAV5DC22_ELECO|nr:hypothetical protein PR202_ga26483 [Eleusine coracana subsp. coracana]